MDSGVTMLGVYLQQIGMVLTLWIYINNRKFVNFTGTILLTAWFLTYFFCVLVLQYFLWNRFALNCNNQQNSNKTITSLCMWEAVYDSYGYNLVLQAGLMIFSIVQHLTSRLSSELEEIRGLLCQSELHHRGYGIHCVLHSLDGSMEDSMAFYEFSGLLMTIVFMRLNALAMTTWLDTHCSFYDTVTFGLRAFVSLFWNMDMERFPTVYQHFFIYYWILLVIQGITLAGRCLHRAIVIFSPGKRQIFLRESLQPFCCRKDQLKYLEEFVSTNNSRYVLISSILQRFRDEDIKEIFIHLFLHREYHPDIKVDEKEYANALFTYKNLSCSTTIDTVNKQV